jgi:hypothetical protein
VFPVFGRIRPRLGAKIREIGLNSFGGEPVPRISQMVASGLGLLSYTLRHVACRGDLDYI